MLVRQLVLGVPSGLMMFVGMDLEEDASRIESWYSQDDRKFKIAVELTVGAQVAFPDQISVINI